MQIQFPNATLLIVDDESDIAENIRFQVRQVVGRTLLAGNGKEALGLLRAERVDCIVCDINMPLMNGVELLRRLRAEGPQVPFIFFTAYGTHELMQEALKYGAFDFLEKPFLDGLAASVRRALGPQGDEGDGELANEYLRLRNAGRAD